MEETPKEEEIPQEEIHSESEYGDFESPIFYTTTYSSQEEDEETTQNLIYTVKLIRIIFLVRSFMFP